MLSWLTQEITLTAKLKSDRAWLASVSGTVLGSARAVLFLMLLGSLGCVREALILPEVGSSTISGKLLGLTTSGQKANAKMQGSTVSTSSLVSTLNCSSPMASLYKIDDNGNRVEPALATSSVDADGGYSFNSKSLGVLFHSSVPNEKLLIAISGCTSGVYLRPITGPKDQDITMGSTVISYLLNTNNKDKIAEAIKNSSLDLNSLMTKLSSASSLSDAYMQLENDSQLKETFSNVFGISPSVLRDAAPEIISYSIPNTASELVSVDLAVTMTHFSSSYQAVYAWKLDGTLIAQQSQFQWTPTANSQGAHTITLTVGENDGSGNINMAKPTKVVTQTLTVSNNILPSAPNFSISHPTITGTQPINTRNLTLSIDTGSSLSNCASFSALAITENDLNVPSPSAFNLRCSQNPTQNVAYTLSSPADGQKTLRLWAMDDSGEISNLATSTSVYLDTGIPTLNLSTSPLALSNLSSQVFVFTAADNGGVIDHFECKIDSNPWTACSTPQSYSNLTEGDHTFSAKAIDTAGNISNIETTSWHIDLTAPVLAISGTPQTITNQLTSTFSFSASDTGGGSIASYLCNLDNTGYTHCTSPFINLLSAGTHTLLLKATDTAGNTSLPQSFSWTIDTSLPSTTISSKPSALTNSSNAIFSFSGSDTGGGTVARFECQLDSLGYSPCASPQSYTGLTQGTHSFAVRAIDTASNIGNAVSYSWTVDSTTPLASINSGPATITNSTSAAFTFSANPPPGGSIAGYECRLDSLVWSTCASPKSYTSLSAAVHTFEVRSIDNNGNRSTATSQTWTVDLIAPTLAIDSKPASMTATTSASFTFSATDSGGGTVSNYSCKLDGNSYSGCSSPISYSSLAQGSHTFYVTATDSASNTSAAQTYTWTTDLTPPTLTISSSPNSVTNSANAAFAFSATDLGGGTVSGFQCSLDGAAYSTCTSGVSYTSLSVGPHQFALIASDTAGNTSSASVYSWTIDQTAPTINISSTPNSSTNSTTASFTFSATDSGGGSVASYSCKLDSGSYSTCTSPMSYSSLTAGAHTFTLTSTDSAGNTSAPAAVAWTVDLTPPVISISSPAANGSVIPVAQLTNTTLSGTCSENGQAISIAGSSTATTSCSGGVWSVNLDLSGLADGTLSLTATQSDIAGNSTTTAARTLIKDTLAPAISLNALSAIQGHVGTGSVSWSLTELNVASGSLFNVEVFDGTSWSTWGSVAANAGINANQSYTLSGLTVPNVDTNAAKFRVTLVDAAGNSTTSTSGNFIIDSTPPVISSLLINDGATSTGLTFVNLKIAASDALSTVAQVRFANTTPTGDCQSLYANNNWVNWTDANTAISYNISSVDGTKKICAWAKDSLGNISTITPSTGTNGVTSANIDYFVGNPPVITAFSVTNNSGGKTFATGDQVNISWTINDVEGLSNAPVTLYKSVNGGSWTQIVSNYGALSGNPTSSTGSYTSMTAPSGVFRIKLVVTDANGNTSLPAISDVMNGNGWSVYMGSTDTGVGGSGTSTTMYKAAFAVSGNQFAVNPINGDIYAISNGRGIYKLNSATGMTSVFMTNGASNFADGINIPTSLLGSTSAMAINFDKAGRLYVSNPEGVGAGTATSVKIWQVDFSTNKISLYLGGGTLPGTGSILPSAGSQAHVTLGAFDIDDNNSLYFFSTCDTASFVMGTATLKYRLLKATQNSNGTLGSFSIIAGDCSATNPTVAADSTATGLGTEPYQHIRQLTTNADGSLIYVTDSGQTPTTYKLVYNNSTSTYKVYSTSLGGRGLVFDRVHNQLYAGNASILKATLNSDLTAAETTSTYVTSNGTGDCDSDGVLASSSCINAYGSNGWAPLEMANDGTLLFTDSNFRIRYVDGNSKLRTIMGTLPFYGEGLNRAFTRGSFYGIYYKTSSLNTTDFPQGLYFLDNNAGILGYVDPATNIVSNLMGNQQFGGSFPADGSVVNKYSNMAVQSGANFTGLNFDSNGLPVLAANNKLIRLKAGKIIETVSGGAYNAANTTWMAAADGTALTSVRFNSLWSLYNLVTLSTNYFFGLGVNNQTAAGPFYGAIGYINTTDAKYHSLMKGLSSSTQTAAADSTVSATVNGSSLSSSCYNSSCYLQYNSVDGILYFSEGNYIRALTNPTSPSTVTLSSPTNLAMGRAVRNFAFSPDNKRVYYNSGGYLYCAWIGSGSAPTNCQNTSLGPGTGFSTLTSLANQFTFIQDGQLLISNSSEIYLYTYTP